MEPARPLITGGTIARAARGVNPACFAVVIATGIASSVGAGQARNRTASAGRPAGLGNPAA